MYKCWGIVYLLLDSGVNERDVSEEKKEVTARIYRFNALT